MRVRDFRELEEPPAEAPRREDSDWPVLELDVVVELELLPDRDLKWNTMRSACFLRDVILERWRRPRCSEITPFAPPVALEPSTTLSNCTKNSDREESVVQQNRPELDFYFNFELHHVFPVRESNELMCKKKNANPHLVCASFSPRPVS